MLVGVGVHRGDAVIRSGDGIDDRRLGDGMRGDNDVTRLYVRVGCR